MKFQNYKVCAKRLNQVTGVISGVITPKDKTKAMPSPLARKKKQQE